METVTFMKFGSMQGKTYSSPGGSLRYVKRGNTSSVLIIGISRREVEQKNRVQRYEEDLVSST